MDGDRGQHEPKIPNAPADRLMEHSNARTDPWRLPAFCLWLVLLVVGLFPEASFQLVRSLGRVMPQHALVNSPFILTLLLSLYVAVFTWYRCLEAETPHAEAQDKSLHMAVVSLVAFLPIDFVSILQMYNNPLVQHHFLIYTGGFLKLTAWIYVLLVVVRYYLAGDTVSFSRVGTTFPSTRKSFTQSKINPDSDRK